MFLTFLPYNFNFLSYIDDFFYHNLNFYLTIMRFYLTNLNFYLIMMIFFFQDEHFIQDFNFSCYHFDFYLLMLSLQRCGFTVRQHSDLNTNSRHALCIHTLTVTAAAVVHVSDAQASLVKLLPLAEHRRPPITGLEQRHAASDWTDKEKESLMLFSKKSLFFIHVRCSRQTCGWWRNRDRHNDGVRDVLIQEHGGVSAVSSAPETECGKGR